MLAMEPDAGQEGRDRRARWQVGLEYVESLQVGHDHVPELQARYDAADAAVLGPIKAMLGLDQVIWAGSRLGADAAGGGPLLRRARACAIYDI